MSTRGPRPVNLRLRRLLVMLPWLMERQTVSTQEMADHFGMTVNDLVCDLTLASMCGVSQDPRDLIDLWVDDDEVHFGVPKYFERPLRLTVPEAFSLIASATAAQQIPGMDATGALARAVAKVAQAIDLEHQDSFAVELDAPESVGLLGRAISESVKIEFDYWSVSTGQSAKRQVVPIEVFLEQDHWYVRAHDLDADAGRTFRLDRIDALHITDQCLEVNAGAREAWFATSDEQQQVTLRVDPQWLWVLEQYPGVTVDTTGKKANADGWAQVTVVTNTQRWLQRLMIRLGVHGEVVAPATWNTLAATTAGSILNRYERKNG